MNKSEQYLRSFLNWDHPMLKGMATDIAARDDIQPAVEPEIARFICLQIRLLNVKRMLELGTSNGYSAIWFAKSLAETDGTLITVDNHERTSKEAAENFLISGLGNRIDQKIGEAATVLAELSAPFDLIFQDCGKATYPELLDRTVHLLRPGGLLIADDTLFSINCDIRKNLGRFTDEYNRMVFSRTDLYSVIIPVGHGLTLSQKI